MSELVSRKIPLAQSSIVYLASISLSHNFAKYWVALNLFPKLSKFFHYLAMHQKHAHRMANSVPPDQTALKSSLIKSYSVCSQTFFYKCLVSVQQGWQGKEKRTVRDITRQDKIKSTRSRKKSVIC